MTSSKLLKILASGSLIFSLSAAAAGAAVPSLTFSPAETTVVKNESFTLDIVLDTAGQNVGGAGAKISFDPLKLRAELITPGDFFADYPAAIIDNQNGRLTISGIAGSASNLYQGRGVFASVDFTALAAGPATVSFDYQPNSTTDSNIATLEPPGDILAQVNQLSLAVGEPGSQGGGGQQDSAPADSGGETAATQEETSAPAQNLIEDFASAWQNLAAVLPWTEEAEPDRAGRPETGELAALEPLTRQTAITDPDQTQPQIARVYESEPKAKKWTEVLGSPEFLIAAAAGLIIVAVLYFLRKRL